MLPKLYGERVNQIVALLLESGEKQSVVKQLLRAIYSNNVNEFRAMHEVPLLTRGKLEEKFGRKYSTLEPAHVSSDSQATKVLFSCHDGHKVESVELAFRNHNSLCISSQIGCAFGCAFCATGKLGIIRQLSIDEITNQVYHFRKKNHQSSVSFMGMGEPLSNPKIFPSISALCSPHEFGIPRSRINVSTIGIAPGVQKLNDVHPEVNLTYSLHSPFPQQRLELMPIQKVYPFQDVFPLLDARISKSKNRVWIAYLLLEGVNDSIDHAKALVSLIRERPQEVRYLYHVNLLPYNAARDAPSGMKRSEDISKFHSELEKAGISHSYRNSFGRSIDAACGQLYADYEARSIRLPSP
jgi:23S rRNA (adenine-C8)-methyltransferase